jgi:hypothetical protein
MALQLTLDLVEDSGLKRTVVGAKLAEQATRVVLVSGLTTGSSSDAATALTRAMNAVALKYPKAQLYSPGSIAMVVAYEAGGMREDPDSIKVRVIYDNPSVSGDPPQNGQNTFTYTDDTTTVADTTQLFRDDINGILKQLIIPFIDPSNGAIRKQVIANSTYESTKRRIVLTGLLLKKDFSPFRKMLNRVNERKWAGLPRGFWRFAGLRTETQDLGKSYYVVAELLADINRDWSKYEVLRDPNTGKYLRIRQKVLDGLVKLPYSHEVIGLAANVGILKIGHYALSDFSGTFGDFTD